MKVEQHTVITINDEKVFAVRHIQCAEILDTDPTIVMVFMSGQPDPHIVHTSSAVEASRLVRSIADAIVTLL